MASLRARRGWLAGCLRRLREASTPPRRSTSSLLSSRIASVDVGGGVGEASDYGDVTVMNDGDLTTTGDSATAIYAQSVGVAAEPRWRRSSR
ncbi:MAG: hypothetical protein HPM95_15270 [Alphaproteobacteria bacterium]|nr:hypothetical protein [Alphaproteobacteria bacterium]